MRRLCLLAWIMLAAGCSDGLAGRQAELARWVGRPEVDLVALMGAPNRSYETDGVKFLTYEDRRVEIVPGSPFYGPGPFGPFGYGGGFPPTAMNLACDTTFTVAGGIVRAFSLRGNACG
ncbi:MAG: hypothetical protein QOH05_3724 [Acetobacteraceae bacterium]|jgi:hypothetical protein|nr:hypothetical protein [Acetobacteraceae bacterium]